MTCAFWVSNKNNVPLLAQLVPIGPPSVLNNNGSDENDSVQDFQDMQDKFSNYAGDVAQEAVLSCEDR